MMEEAEWVSEDEEEREEDLSDSFTRAEIEHGELEYQYMPFLAPLSQVMLIVGRIEVSKVVILVDMGSTHNLLDPLVVQKNNLLVTKYSKLCVKVANGDNMMAEGGCEGVAVKMQG